MADVQATAATASAGLSLGAGTGVAPNVRPAEAASLAGVTGVTGGSRPWFTIMAVVTVFVALIGTFILYFMNVATQARITDAEDRVKRLNQQIASPPLSQTDRQLKGINNSLQGYKTAAAKIRPLGTLINQLPSITPKDMAISSMVIDEKSNIRIVAEASAFETAGKALQSFQQVPLLTNVKLENLTFSEKEGKRRINFEFSGALNKETPKTNASPSPAATP